MSSPDPTGVGDSTGWIQAQLDSAHGVCVLPQWGRYRLTEPLVLNRGHQSLIGHGGMFATQLVMDPDIDAPSLVCDRDTRLMMQGVTFLQDSPVRPQHRSPLVQLRHTYQSILRDVFFMYGYADGLVMEEGSNNRLENVFAQKNGRAFVATDRVCPLMPTGTPARGMVLRDMSNFHIVGGAWEYNQGGGIHIDNSRIREDTGGVIEHGRIEGNNQFALRADCMARLHIRHMYSYATDMIFGASSEQASCKAYDISWGPDSELVRES
jgi:hypothetical protein